MTDTKLIDSWPNMVFEINGYSSIGLTVTNNRTGETVDEIDLYIETYANLATGEIYFESLISFDVATNRERHNSLNDLKDFIDMYLKSWYGSDDDDDNLGENNYKNLHIRIVPIEPKENENNT